MLPVSTLDCSTTNSPSWAVVLLLLQMSYSPLNTRKRQTSQTYGGAISSKTLPLFSSIIAALYVQSTSTFCSSDTNMNMQAITTYACTALMFASARNPILRAALPPLSRRMATSAFAMANIQVLLGISTLLYLVPVPLAALHQAGSVALLTTLVHLVVSLRRPGAAARAWRQALRASKSQGLKH